MSKRILAARWIGSSLCLALTGCVGMKRFDLGPKTIPSVGDRQISVTAGRPGEDSIIRTETATPKLDMRVARRISGRVIDHRGQPISGATVRLADGALATGQISDVITDEAGGFTVRGLRASTPYTVIATLDLGGETRVARARFVSGETQARVVLEPAEVDASVKAPVATAKNVRRAESLAPPVDQRAEAADSIAAAPAVAQTNAAPTRPPLPPKGRWVFIDESDQVVANVPVRSTDDGVKRVSGRPNVQDQPAEETDVPAPRKKPVNSAWRSAEQTTARPTARDAGVRLASFDSDEENPLPPARERKAFVYEEFVDEPEAPPTRRIASGAILDTPGPLPDELVPVTETPTDEELAANVRQPRPRSVRPDSASRALPARRTAGFYSDAPSAGSMRVEDIDEVNRVIRERRARERGVAAEDASDEESRRSPTWEEVARPLRVEYSPRTDRTINRTVRSDEPPAEPAELADKYLAARPGRDSAEPAVRGLERSMAQRESIDRSLKNASAPASSISRSDDAVARSDQERIDRLKAAEAEKATAFNGETPRTPNEWINRLTAGLPWVKKTPEATGTTVSGSFCDFDTENQRIVEFELTDIKGRSTRFSQIPAELTLLVFWGTWCKPCHEAMPHLVELQKRLEADGVQVLAIAYEEGTIQERQDKIAAAVERYDINFPILLGGSQGADSCPVRKAMGVRVYPTLVLVDRSGRVLWRDQGVTQATFGRLDRVMAAHLQDLDQRQLAVETAKIRR